MPFGNISAFYLPVAATAGSSQWGTDVRKLLSASEAGETGTTQTDQGTSVSAVVRTLDPYTTTTADLDQSLYGWAITPADMGSVAGAKRFFPAGNHTLTIRVSQNGATAVVPTITLSAYRVGPSPTRTRTLLGSATGGVNIPGLSGEATQTVTLSLPEIIFEPDETIQYSMEVSCTGIAVTGRILTWWTGTRASVPAVMTTPTLKVLADTTGSATGSGSASGESSKVLNTIGSGAGSGVASGTGASRADTVGSAAGSVTVSGEVSSVAGAVGSASGAGNANGVLTGIGGMVGESLSLGEAIGILGATGGMVGESLSLGEAIGVLGATGGMIGTAEGTSIAIAEASSVAGSVGSALGLADAAGVGGKVVGTVGTVAIGGPGSEEPAVIIRPTIILVDD